MNPKTTLLFFILIQLSIHIFSQTVSKNKDYIVWDDEPAPNRGGDISIQKAGGFPYDEDWEKRSYPIGNGYMGANIFGRTDVERIQITEKTMFNKGLYALGGLTNFAEINLEIGHLNPENYRRSINLNEAISTVNYTLGGTEYSREYFMSYPDNVLVIKLSSNKKGAISLTLKPEIPYLRDTINRYWKVGTMSAKKNLITMSGMDNYFNVKFETQIKIINQGGKLITSNDKNKSSIKVSKADEVLIIIAAGTNYELSEQLFLTERNNTKLDINKYPHHKVTSLISNAVLKGYKKLKAAHLSDYQNLFSRVSIDLGNLPSKQKTIELLKDYKSNNKNTYLEELLFQYGRYLLISSSRKGALPSGLQGVWSQYEITPWTGGYWHNINIQMNYWGAMNTNLAETFTPYIEYHQAYIPKAYELGSRYIQRKHPDHYSEETRSNGWTIGTAANPYKIRASGGHSGPGTGGMTSKLLWEYYDFTRDTIFLKKIGYPALLGMSKFLSKTVEPSPEGHLLIQNSASPEIMHDGKYYMTTGSTFDQGFVWENHSDLLKAAVVLGKSDEFLDLVKTQLPKLDPIIIGKSGQIKEFREEQFYGEIGESNHRHVSHLCPLYPGTLINSATLSWLQAAKVSLDLRGNDTSGWGMAHRLNLRARTKDGEKSYELVKKIVAERTLPNLWMTHPPFQIDANLGYIAGVAEMLLQSHEGYIEPLVALPKAWQDGSYQGLVARGNFEISTSWKKGKANSLKIKSRVGGNCSIKYANISNASVIDILGNGVKLSREGLDRISFNTKKGKTYLISFKK